jgi:ribosome-associated translation inhibitor RaiA
MTIPIEVHFHGIEKSEAVESHVRTKVVKLGKHFARMTRCRVVLEALHRNAQRPLAHQVKIEIGVPQRRPIVISHERPGSNVHEELLLAIRDAFAAAVRKCDGLAVKIGQRGKLERGRRRPSRANGVAEAD